VDQDKSESGLNLCYCSLDRNGLGRNGVRGCSAGGGGGWTRPRREFSPGCIRSNTTEQQNALKKGMMGYVIGKSSKCWLLAAYIIYVWAKELKQTLILQSVGICTGIVLVNFTHIQYT
jgi:hypothetical protein